MITKPTLQDLESMQQTKNKTNFQKKLNSSNTSYFVLFYSMLFYTHTKKKKKIKTKNKNKQFGFLNFFFSPSYF